MFWSQAPGKDFGANVFGARPQEKISEPIVLEPGPPGKGIGASGFGARPQEKISEAIVLEPGPRKRFRSQ